MTDLTRWLIGFGGFAVLLVALHFLARLFSPRNEGDPRLGPVGFWVWAGAIAVCVYFVLEPLDPPDWPIPIPDGIRLVLFGLWVVLWLANKLGYFEWPDWWRDSQEDHEEAWATVVGVLIGLVAPSILAALPA